MELIISDIKKTFGEKVALNIDKCIVGEGELVGLVGNNGAGKTTLFRIMLDLLQPDCGEVAVKGIYDDKDALCITSKSEDWKHFTGAYIDSGFLIDYLTPEEYFRFLAKVNGISEPQLYERLKDYDQFMNGEVLGQNLLIRNLSAGNKQKVGIIGAMINNPSLLVLDEPFNFLDPSSQIAMKYMLDEYNRKYGATIIVSSHNLTHTIDICNRAILLEHGCIIKDYTKSQADDMMIEIEDYFMHGLKNHSGEVCSETTVEIEITQE